MSQGHVAIVLAAGGSQRLGRPKQLLTINGETLLARCVRLAAETAPERIIVVLGAHAAAMREQLQHVAIANLRCIDNPSWQQGMASSLQAAAAELADWDSRSLLLACDQPRLTPSHLHALLTAARSHPDHDIASAYADAIGIPALIRATSLQAARNLHGDRGLRALWRDPSARVHSIRADELSFDIDTPQDLQHAIDAGWVERPA